MSLYQEEGAKLFVRLKATGADEANASTIEASKTWTYGDQKNVAVYEVTTLPGKETKVSIPAKAKGPKATADYAKGTVEFPRGSEFRLATATEIYLKDEKTVDSPTEKKTCL